MHNCPAMPVKDFHGTKVGEAITDGPKKLFLAIERMGKGRPRIPTKGKFVTNSSPKLVKEAVLVTSKTRKS